MLLRKQHKTLKLKYVRVHFAYGSDNLSFFWLNIHGIPMIVEGGMQ